MFLLSQFVVMSLAWTGLCSPVPGGYSPKCRTVYETAYSTSYEQQCTTIYEQQCSTSYEQQCSTTYEEQCSTTVETSYEQQCSTSYEQQCSTAYETSYQEKCSTNYKQVCTSSGQEDMAREVMAMENNRNAPNFPGKVSPAFRSKIPYRNTHTYPRKTVTAFLDRAVQVCPYRHLRR